MQRLPWVERRFHFELPVGWRFNVAARLAGAIYHLQHLGQRASETEAAYKPNGKWSIKEHIGHLIDLEALHLGRFDDFQARVAVLRAADMANKKTEAASHNSQSIALLLAEFELERKRFIQVFLDLDEATHHFTAQHPRLQISMRPVDMAAFVAEHDDHHIASIKEILGS